MKIPSMKPYFTSEDKRKILRDFKTVLDSGRLYNGIFIKRFEQAFTRIVETRYAVALNSGTSALQIALEYFDIENKEVITPTNTFIATSNAVLFARGTPILADIDQETLCLNLKTIKEKYTKRTKGVILVHVNGFITPEIKKIKAFCKKKRIFLLEDASHAHGAEAYGRKAGSWGDAAAFSCLATKVMTTGGVGGVLTTNDKKLEAFARSLRFHGEDSMRGIQDRLGSNWFMSELQAIVGFYQTKRLSQIVQKRNKIAREYDKAFEDLTRVMLFLVPKGFKHSYYKYALTLKNTSLKERLKVMLQKKGVATGGIYWPPCHLQPVYKKKFGFKKGDFKVAQDILSRTITLPMYSGMKSSEIKYVIKKVKECMQELS